jgi:hypothetical protein
MKAVLYDDNNIVTNIIVWDSESSLNTQNYLVVDDDLYVSIGWKLINGQFEPTEIETPITISKSLEQIIEEQQLFIATLTERIEALEKK